MENPHGAHICVLTRNRPDYLGKTIESVRNQFYKTHGIYIIHSHTSYPIPSGCEDLYVPECSTHGSLMNHVCEALRNLRISRVVFIWEGEVVTGTPYMLGWPSEPGAFLKINSANSFFWQVRMFHLREPWTWTDPLGEIPTLPGPPSSSRLTKLEGDYLIVDLVDTDREPPRFGMKNHYVYRRACHALLHGECQLAESLFMKRSMSNTGAEVISRCHLGKAICAKIRGDTWAIIHSLLKLSIDSAPTTRLEAPYFLVAWAMEWGEVAAAFATLDNAKINLTVADPPSKGLLPYDESIYHYGFLYMYTKAANSLYQYRTVKDSSGALLERTDIPLEVRSDLIQMGGHARNRLLALDVYTEAIEGTMDVLHPQVTLTVEKGNIIQIVPIESQSTEWIEPYTKDVWNWDGVRLQIGGVSDPSLTLHVTQPKQEWFMRGTLGEMFPETPLLAWSVDGIPTPPELVAYPNKQYRAVLLDRSGKHSIRDYRVPITQLESFPADLRKVNTVIYYGTEPIMDVMTILLCALQGCQVFYSGTSQVYRDVKHILGDSLIHVSSWTDDAIEREVLLRMKTTSTRALTTATIPYILPSIILRFLKLKPCSRIQGIYTFGDAPGAMDKLPTTSIHCGNVPLRDVLRRCLKETDASDEVYIIRPTSTPLSPLVYKWITNALDDDTLLHGEIWELPTFTDDTPYANLATTLDSQFHPFEQKATYGPELWSRPVLIRSYRVLQSLYGAIIANTSISSQFTIFSFPCLY